MAIRKRHWLWNTLIALTIVICLAAFILHSKNWIRQEEGGFTLISGFYYSEIRYDSIEKVSMVPRIPEMKRESGFSAWAIEKGIFRDTVQGLEGIRVYVDNLKNPKIILEQGGSPPIYFNFKDSLETVLFYDKLIEDLKKKEAEN
ncbi:hypothetical protein ACA086_03035 [Muriicola sp. E247]|uniref:hypothetical protein n=1 Tax=Muriicola sp. E247 TaxID=3242730 RepID=UPI003524139C